MSSHLDLCIKASDDVSYKYLCQYICYMLSHSKRMKEKDQKEKKIGSSKRRSKEVSASQASQ